MQIIFQDPLAALDPRMTVGSIVGEPLDTFEPGLADGVRRLPAHHGRDASGGMSANHVWEHPPRGRQEQTNTRIRFRAPR